CGTGTCVVIGMRLARYVGARDTRSRGGTMSSAISLSKVSVVTSGATLLDDVDWEVREGERWVVLGPNGAGKTTLLHVIGAQLHPTTGTARILDERLGSVDVFELRTRIGHTSMALADRIPPTE